MAKKQVELWIGAASTKPAREMTEHQRRVAAAIGRYERKVAGREHELRAELEAAERAKQRKRARGGERSEYQEQAIVCDWLKLHRVLYFAVPNGAWLAGANPAARGATWRKLARVGAKPGVPDLIIAAQNKHGRHTALEMKRRTGGTVSTEQREWLGRLSRAGWDVIVGRGADDAIRQLSDLGYGADRRR